MNFPHSTVVLSRRAAFLALCAALPFGQLACGISGGSIPPGRASGLQGQVVLAENTATPLPNSTVSVLVTPDNGVSTLVETKTDAAGRFALQNLSAGVNYADLVVTVKPFSEDERSQQITVRIPARRTTTLISALTRSTTDISQIAEVGVSPQKVVVRPGDTVKFKPVFRDSAGNVLALPLAATLVLTDDRGTLMPDGTFTASASGAVSLKVFWYNALSATAAVNVQSPGEPITPPPPPAETVVPNQKNP